MMKHLQEPRNRRGSRFSNKYQEDEWVWWWWFRTGGGSWC